MKKIIFSVLLLLHAGFTIAQPSLSFAIVPQQSASKLAKLWTPIIKELSQQSGIDLHFATAPDIPTFEKRLSEGLYDIAYMNPYHYILFNQKIGYQALAKEQNKQIKGIIVVAKKSQFNNLQDLQNKTLAFPAPRAFAATLLTQAALAAQNINITAHYVSSHDSVYRSVAKGIYPAGGGVLRTFNNVAPEIREQLKILETTTGYTPHAIANHPRISDALVAKLQHALLQLGQQTIGKKLLADINISGFSSAIDSDWDDIRTLNIHPLTEH